MGFGSTASCDWIMDGEYQRFPRWLGFMGGGSGIASGWRGRHCLVERRFQLLPWSSRSLRIMEAVMRNRAAILTT
jgi:hypothetical protein